MNLCRLKLVSSCFGILSIIILCWACKVHLSEALVKADSQAVLGYACLVKSDVGGGYLFKPDGTYERGYDCAASKVGVNYACAVRSGAGYLFKPDGTYERGYDCAASKVGVNYACAAEVRGTGYFFKPDGTHERGYDCAASSIPGAN